MSSERFHLLHLEDSVRDAQMIWDMLEDEGFQFDVVHALDKSDFLTALDEKTYDLILCDCNLPSYSAFSALDLVREKNSVTPFMIVSGTIGEEEAVKGLHKGATDYLLKNNLGRLGPAVRRALQEAEEKRQRHNAEEERHKWEERMRLALAATNEAIWDLDLVGDTLVCNESFVSLFGPPPEHKPEEWLQGRLHPDDRDRINESLDSAFRAGEQFWSESYRMQKKDGSWAHVQNRVCLSRNLQGEVIRLVGAIQDMTASMEAEEKRRALEEQLIQSQKMEAVGTLAGGIAHDFNNILGIILTNSELAQANIHSGHIDPDMVEECIGETISASDRARNLVRQILTFSRSGKVQRKLVNPTELLEECLQLLRSTLPAMVKLEADLSPRIPAVLADVTQLHQVVMNLCTNSWHALPEKGGHITVSLDEVNLKHAEATPAGEIPAGGYVRITVADDGHGIPPDVLSRIFEPFFTTKEIGKGTGLGLAMVHGIVKKHDGFIKVKSTEGEGTSFDLFFPAHHEQVEEQKGEVSISTRGRGQTILLVDDDKAMARATERVLKRSGYIVECIHTPAAALKALGKPETEYELLLTDYSMPEMSGLELAERVEKIDPDLPVILLSGLAETGLRSRIRSANIREVVEKPVWPEVLCRSVGQVFADEEKKPEQEAHILVVDDDKAHGKACVRILKEENFHVHIAMDGREALRVIAEHSIDIVLTDILMPEKEGLELIMDLKRDYPDIRVIAMSGGGMVSAEDCLGYSRRLNVYHTLSKPFNRAELLSAIRATLESKAPEQRKASHRR